MRQAWSALPEYRSFFGDRADNIGFCALAGEGSQIRLEPRTSRREAGRQSSHLLPALPEVWQAKGRFSGMCARGGFVVDAEWRDGQLTRVVVHARRGGETAIEGPGLPRQLIRLAAGESRTLMP